jgi:zinc ribbon protein
MQCPRCRTENPPGKIVCRNCGARLRPAPSTGAAVAPARGESDDQLRRRLNYDLLRIVWVMAVVIVVGLGLGFLVK